MSAKRYRNTKVSACTFLIMTHPDVSAIAAIAHCSNVSLKLPHIFAGLMKLYDGTELPSSTQIISDTWLAKNDCRGRSPIESFIEQF